MKRLPVTVLIVALAFAATSGPAFAKDGPLEKLNRGLTNIVTGPCEIYTQSVITSTNHNSVVGIFAGLIKGVGTFVAREAVGVYDVITFPVPFPKNYRAVYYPDTTFTDWEIRQA